MIRILVIGLVGVVSVVGCGSGDDQLRDASIGGSGGDGGVSGSGGTGGMAPACFEMLVLNGELGGECREPENSCATDSCIQEVPAMIGGPDDPILNYPPGENVPIDAPLFVDSYCTLPVAATQTGCDPDACLDLCGFCTGIAGQEICMNACNAEIDTNSVCRPGYECDLLGSVCFPGCASDDECRVSREGDQLVYSTTSEAFCNMDTYRCEHPGTPGVEAGAACTIGEECEANGLCLDEETFDFPGGYCSKIRCDLDGNECEGDGVCAALGFGVPLCAQSCQVGAGATPGDPSTYLNNTQGCREGYTCFWGGIPDDTAGACIPGVFNDVTMNNIGADCATNDTCYSPFGQGVCADDELACSLLGAPAGEACPTGFGCTVLDCAVPGMPDDVCGDDATCVALQSGLSLCLQNCAGAQDCLPGAACFDLDGDLLTLDSICFPLCLDDSECRGGETCNADGECVPAP